MRISDRYTLFQANAQLQSGICLTDYNAKAVADGTVESGEGENKKTLKKFELLAYTGGAMRLQSSFYPVVFDLGSMKAATNVPLLFNHSEEDIVGHAPFDSIKINNPKNVKAIGIISGVSERSKEINATADNEFPWQISIGLLAGSTEFVREGEKVTVNSRQFTGPLIIARNGMIREFSFVPMGADSNALATLKASYIGGKIMYETFEEYLAALGIQATGLPDDRLDVLQASYDGYKKEKQDNKDDDKKNNKDDKKNVHLDGKDVITDMRASAAAERNRIDSINSLAVKYDNPVTDGNKFVASLAIEKGWTTEKTELELIKASRPKGAKGDSGNSDSDSSWGLVFECAVAQSAKLPDVEKKYTPQILEAAHKRFKSRLGLQELLLEAAHANGYHGGVSSIKSDLGGVLKAAFSSIVVPTILSNNTNQFLLAGYMSVDDSWRKLAAIGRVSDFKETTNLRGIGSFTFEQIAPDGLIPHGRMTEESYGNKADTYAKMVAITRVDIINDDLGVFTNVPKKLGRGGKLKLVRTFWEEFLDNSSFFHSSNSNVSTGAAGVAGYNAALAVFRKLKGPDGEYVLGTPKYVVAPPELEVTVNSLYVDQNLAGGVTTGTANNPHYRKFEPIISPYLSDSTITGYSTTAYYIVADPNDIPVIEVVFLDGQETPTVETAEVDFNRLGIQMRGFFDFGVRKQDKRGGVRSTGA
jgi:hypothetical protein